MSEALYRAIDRHVPIERLLLKWGVTPNESGYIKCPFHRQETPSLKVYGGAKGWYCFSCNRGGSSLQFYMSVKRKRKTITKEEAALELAKIFKISVDGHVFGGITAQERREKEKRAFEAFANGFERSIAKDICRRIENGRGIKADGFEQSLGEFLFMSFMAYGFDELAATVGLCSRGSSSVSPLVDIQKRINGYLDFCEEIYYDCTRQCNA